MRWTIGILFLARVAMAQQPAGGSQPQSITVDEAVRRARLVQPAMVQAEGAERTAAAAKLAALGAFLPQVTLNSSASRPSHGVFDLNTHTVLPSTYNYTGQLRASISAFTGIGQIANLSAAGASQSAAEAGYINQEYQTALATKQAFYNALASEDLVRAAESQVRRTQQELQISVEKLHAGSATRSDSLRSVVDLGNARLTLLQAQANLANAQATLGRQIGVDGPVRAVPDTVLPALPDTMALRSAMIESSPQVQQAEAQARAARASLWSTRTQYLPSLSIAYGDTRQDSILANAFGRRLETFSWTFGLSFTVFNGFTREQNHTSARVQRDVAEATAADARRAVSALLTQQLAALTTAYAQIDIAQSNLAAATEDLRVQQERYRVGAATILDVLTSQASLTQADVSVVQARFNYQIARAQLEAVLGRRL